MLYKKDTKTGSIYEVDSIKISYNSKTKLARYKDLNGKDCRRIKTLPITEQQFIENLIQEINGTVLKSKNILSQLIDSFKQSRVGIIAPRTVAEEDGLFKLINHYFANTDFITVKKSELRMILEDIAKDRSTMRSNRIRKKIQQLFDFVVARELIEGLQSNPFHGVLDLVVVASEKRKKAFFETTHSEHSAINRLVSVCENPTDKLLLQMLILTGGRISEVLLLKWEHLNIDKPQEPILKIRNSKVKYNGNLKEEDMPVRLLDINPDHLINILEQKRLIDKHVAELREIYNKTNGRVHFLKFVSPDKDDVEPISDVYSDKRTEHKWKWIISTENGNRFSYTGAYSRYKRIWKRAYEKYKDHPVAWELGDTPCNQGFGFHAFRRFYICSFRDSYGQDYTQAKHQDLQQLVGHKIGSNMTDSVYTDFKLTAATEQKHNSKINNGVIFK